MDIYNPHNMLYQKYVWFEDQVTFGQHIFGSTFSDKYIVLSAQINLQPMNAKRAWKLLKIHCTRWQTNVRFKKIFSSASSCSQLCHISDSQWPISNGRGYENCPIVTYMHVVRSLWMEASKNLVFRSPEVQVTYSYHILSVVVR